MNRSPQERSRGRAGQCRRRRRNWPTPRRPIGQLPTDRAAPWRLTTQRTRSANWPTSRRPSGHSVPFERGARRHRRKPWRSDAPDPGPGSAEDRPDLLDGADDPLDRRVLGRLGEHPGGDGVQAAGVLLLVDGLLQAVADRALASPGGGRATPGARWRPTGGAPRGWCPSRRRRCRWHGGRCAGSAPSRPSVATLTERSQGSGTARALSVNAPRWISTTMSTARAARAAAIARWPTRRRVIPAVLQRITATGTSASAARIAHRMKAPRKPRVMASEITPLQAVAQGDAGPARSGRRPPRSRAEVGHLAARGLVDGLLQLDADRHLVLDRQRGLDQRRRRPPGARGPRPRPGRRRAAASGAPARARARRAGCPPTRCRTTPGSARAATPR